MPPFSQHDSGAERIGSVTKKPTNFSFCLLQILTNSPWARPRAKQKVPDPHHTISVSPSLPLLSCTAESRNGGEEKEKLPMRPPGSALRLQTSSSLSFLQKYTHIRHQSGRGVPFEGRGVIKGWREAVWGVGRSCLLVPREAESEAESRRSEVGSGRRPRSPWGEEPQTARKIGDVAMLHRYCMVGEHSVFVFF